MFRAEIISNQSVQEDIIERLEKEIPSIEYTVIPELHGRGIRTKKLGDTIWPEMNFVLFSYIDDDNAQKIKEVVADVKKRFPKEGISLFFTKAEDFLRIFKPFVNQNDFLAWRKKITRRELSAKSGR